MELKQLANCLAGYSSYYGLFGRCISLDRQAHLSHLINIYRLVTSFGYDVNIQKKKTPLTKTECYEARCPIAQTIYHTVECISVATMERASVS